MPKPVVPTPGRDGRGSSVVVNYVAVLAIVSLLGAGLFLATHDLVQNERERAIRGEFQVIGNRIAGDLTRIDAMANGPGVETAAVRVRLADAVAGSSYHVTVEDRPGDRARIRLASSDPEVVVLVAVTTETPVATGTVDGGPLVIQYDATTDRLEVTDG